MFKGAALSDLPPISSLGEALRDKPTLILAWADDPTHPLSTALALQEALPLSEIRIASNYEEICSWDQDINHFLAQLAP